MAQRQNKCNIINKYVQQNIQRYLQFIKIPLKMTKWKLHASEYWQFLIVYVSSFCCWVYAVMEMTSNPWSVAKPETFQSLSLTTGLDYHLFNSPSALSVWWSRPPGHSNHSEHPERLPSRRVLKAAGKRETRGRVSLGAACVRYKTCPSLFAERRTWHTHTNIDFRFYREMSTSVCCLTLWWQIGHKQIEVEAPRGNR